jgi:hypothetical protein
VSTPAETQTKSDLRAAMEARDRAALVDAFAPDAVFRSPLTARFTFKGREQIGALIDVVLDVFDDFHYTDELLGRDEVFLVARAQVAGRDLEMVDHIRLDEQGKIRELTVFFRPLPAIAVAMRLIGSGLVRPHSAGRAIAISLLTRPLGLLTGVGDRIGARLVGSAL